MSLANAAHQTSETQGTGTLSLSAAAVEDRELLRVALARATGDGAGPWTNVPYVIAQTGGGRELGIGTVTAGSPDTLTRTVIVESTNGGAAVDWGPGTKDVIIAPSAQILQKLYAAGASATAGTLVERDGAGRARVADPDDDADIATKGYVDGVGDAVTEAAATAAEAGDTAVTEAAAEALAGHTGNTDNPHGVTKEQVGLGAVLDFAQLYFASAPTLAETGSMTLANGSFTIIVKWGRTTAPNGRTDVAFASAFPNAHFVAIGCGTLMSDVNSNVHVDKNGTAGISIYVGGTGQDVNWLAIGN